MEESDLAEFEQFTRRLIRLARGRLDAQMRHKIDPEDVVQSAYKSFLLRYGDKELSAKGLDGLWSLLTLITLRKCADRVRYYRADRRDVRRELAADELDGWRESAGREPTPEQAAMLTETVEQILGQLTSTERPVLEMCLQGYSTQEISQQLGRAERSVRRLRQRFRHQLLRLQGMDAVSLDQ